MTFPLFNCLFQWQAGMCASLNIKKLPRVAEILATTYDSADVIMLQEVAVGFVHDLRRHPELSRRYRLVAPADFESIGRDQLSVMLLRRSR